jgi:hypothetical protein
MPRIDPIERRPDDPTPEEIEAMTRAIQRKWSDRRFEIAAGVPPWTRLYRLVMADDLPVGRRKSPHVNRQTCEYE